MAAYIWLGTWVHHPQKKVQNKAWKLVQIIKEMPPKKFSIILIVFFQGSFSVHKFDNLLEPLDKQIH